MAIENTYLLGKNITLGCGFDLQAKAPLDSRQTVPSFAGLQALINYDAAYEGMIVYDEETKKTYQAQKCDSYTVEVDDKTKTYDIRFREFGINEAELKDLIASETTAAMEFKGAATALPENPTKGDMYKVTATFKVGEEDVKVGDSIVYDGEQWFIIPSGDDIEDTWRPVAGVDNDATLTFTAGDKLEKTVAADGTVTYKHVAIDAPTNMNEDGDEQTRTYITQLITDNHGHIIGFKTATENVEDTNTTYTFEGQSDEATSVYFQVTSSEEGVDTEVIYLDAYSKNEADAELAKKLDKSVYETYIDGKAMSDAELKKYAEDYADGLAGNYAAAEHTHEVADITDFDSAVKAYDYATKTEAQAMADGKDEAIAAAQKAADDVAAYVGEFTHATAKTVVEYVNAKTDGIATSGNLEALAGRVTAVEGDVSTIKSDYLKAADIADFETKENVKKVSDDLAAYVESNNAALAAETKARTDADAGFETRIASLEANFGDGEGTVEAQIAAAVKAEEDARKEAVKGVQDEVDAVEGRMDTAEGKITALEGASATHALKTDVEAVEAKLADYKTAEAQKAIDDEQDRRLGVIEGDYLKAADIANFETKENVKKVSDDLAAYVDANDKALADVKATAEAARTEDEVNSQIDAKITALNLGATYEPIGAEDRAKAYADGLISDADLDQYTTEQEVKDIVDEVIAGAVDGDTITGLANLVEYLNTHGAEAKEMGAAIDVLEGKVENIESKPAYGITTTQITNWDAEVGAKALAETKTTTAEVKSQIEAYGYATTGYADGKAADAQAAAEATAAGALASARTEITAEIDADVKALADGQVKANTEAIATKANTVDVYAKTETFTKDEVNAAIAAAIEAAHTWGTF